MMYVQKPNDPARDFCQWPYKRPRSPAIGAWRQEKILFDFLDKHQCQTAVYDRLRHIQNINGRFNTVWGLKSDGNDYSLELYFYDYDRALRHLQPEEILSAAQIPVIAGSCPAKTLEYFMWSIELDLFTQKPAEDIDVYCNGTGGTLSGGICYTLCQNQLELKNLYYFFQSAPDRAKILDQLSASPHSLSVKSYPDSLLPGAMEEEIYVVAIKRRHASVYFSRAPLQHCIAQLRKHGFLTDLALYLDVNTSKLEHHLFDIGIDYRLENNKLKISRMAIFGIF